MRVGFVLFALALAGCATQTPVAPTPTRPLAANEVNFVGPGGITLRGVLIVPTAQPNSTQKRPAIVFQHGCGGPGAQGRLSMRHQAAMDWAVGRGYIALHVDSLGPRGEREICTQRFADRTITQKVRVADAYAALSYLAQRSDVDASRIALWGWSHGGGSVVGALRAPAPREATQRFALGISFYPGCTTPARNEARYTPLAPLHIYIGAEDDWTPAAPCVAFARDLQARGEPVSVQTYAGAYHGFDDPNPNATVRVRKDVPNGVNPGQGVHNGPHPPSREAAMRAIGEVFTAAFDEKK
jgi:dienelactone hydrolase